MTRPIIKNWYDDGLQVDDIIRNEKDEIGIVSWVEGKSFTYKVLSDHDLAALELPLREDLGLVKERTCGSSNSVSSPVMD